MHIQKILEGLILYISGDVAPSVKGFSRVGLEIMLAAIATKLPTISTNLVQRIADNPILSQLGLVSNDGTVNFEAVKQGLLNYVDINGPLTLTSAEISDLIGKQIHLGMLEGLLFDRPTLIRVFAFIENS